MTLKRFSTLSKALRSKRCAFSAISSLVIICVSMIDASLMTSCIRQTRGLTSKIGRMGARILKLKLHQLNRIGSPVPLLVKKPWRIRGHERASRSRLARCRATVLYVRFPDGRPVVMLPTDAANPSRRIVNRCSIASSSSWTTTTIRSRFRSITPTESFHRYLAPTHNSFAAITGVITAIASEMKQGGYRRFCATPKTREESRAEILALIAAHPHASRSELWRRALTVVTWANAHDFDWVQTVFPTRRLSRSAKSKGVLQIIEAPPH